MGKRVKVISENKKSENRLYQDTITKKKMTKKEFVKEIENGSYENYHVRKINGVKTPASNPDKSEENNLG